MYRQSPDRNHRSKGIKVKHVLQFCLLLAVCFWLIYQVKYSHDKKREFDESDAKTSLRRGNSDNIIQLGRKDIRLQGEETISKNEKHDEASEEEETTGEEVEENKPGENGQEDEKVEEKEDERMGDGEDEIDEHEGEKSDIEVDREEDFVDDEREREDGDEKEIEEKDSKDGNGQMENESSVEDRDRDGDDRTHEAREQQYKADDASSAVTHDTEIGTTENENTSTENSNEHPENILVKENNESNSEETNKGENRKKLEVDGSKMAKGDNHLDVTTKENMLDDSENGSSSSNMATYGSDNLLQVSNSSTEVRLENRDLYSQNVTESKSDLEKANNSTLDVDNRNMDSNSKYIAETKDAESITDKFSSSTNNIESAESEHIIRSEASVEAGNNKESSTEKNDSIKPENFTSDGTDEVLESTMTENSEEVPHDSIDFSDSSNALEEKDVRTGLDTLPEIQTEGTNREDAAAE